MRINRKTGWWNNGFNPLLIRIDCHLEFSIGVPSHKFYFLFLFLRLSLEYQRKASKSSLWQYVYINFNKGFNQIWNRVAKFLLLGFSLEYCGHPNTQYPLIKIDHRIFTIWGGILVLVIGREDYMFVWLKLPPLYFLDLWILG